jgi:hypothetical protein
MRNVPFKKRSDYSDSEPIHTHKTKPVATFNYCICPVFATNELLEIGTAVISAVISSMGMCHKHYSCL